MTQTLLDFSPASVAIRVPQDTDWSFVATLKDQNGTPLNLTGATVSAIVYTQSTGASAATLTTSIVSPATNGQVLVSVTRAVTATLAATNYSWVLTVTDSGSLRRKYLAGAFTLPDAWAGGKTGFLSVSSSGAVRATATAVDAIEVITIGIQGTTGATGGGGDGDSSDIIAEVPFSYNVVTTFPLVTIAADTRVYRSAILITTAFNDGAAALTIGDSGDTDRLMTTPQNSPSAVGLYESHPGYLYGSSTAVNLYVSPGSSTQGAGVVYLFKN